MRAAVNAVGKWEHRQLKAGLIWAGFFGFKGEIDAQLIEGC